MRGEKKERREEREERREEREGRREEREERRGDQKELPRVGRARAGGELVPVENTSCCNGNVISSILDASGNSTLKYGLSLILAGSDFPPVVTSSNSKPSFCASLSSRGLASAAISNGTPITYKYKSIILRPYNNNRVNTHTHTYTQQQQITNK